MGGKADKQQHSHGQIFIETETITHMAGQQLHGIVHVDLQKHFPTSCVFLEIIGQEKTTWVQPEKKEKESYMKKCMGKNRFFYISHAIHRFDNNLAIIGQYSFPFSIDLPNWLPQSFFFVGEKSSKLSVTYEIRARIEENTHSSKITIPPLQTRKKLVVMQSLYSKAVNMDVRISHTLKTFLFKNEGKSEALVSFEKDSYSPDEFANVKTFIDNSLCNKDLDKLKIKLKRDIVAFSRDGCKFNQSTVVTKRVFTGAEALSNVERLISLHLKDGSELEKFMREYRKQKQIDPEDCYIMEHLIPSVHSDLINCQYYLEVHFEHKGFTFGSKLKPAIMPIHIYSPIIPLDMGRILKPANWNPQIFRQLHFIVPEQQHAQQYYRYLNAPQPLIQCPNKLENPYAQSSSTSSQQANSKNSISQSQQFYPPLQMGGQNQMSQSSTISANVPVGQPVVYNPNAQMNQFQQPPQNPYLMQQQQDEKQRYYQQQEKERMELEVERQKKIAQQKKEEEEANLMINPQDSTTI